MTDIFRLTKPRVRVNRGQAHTKLVKACKQLIELHGGECMTNTVSLTKKPDGGRIKTGEPGWADIIACMPGGRFLAVECKTGKGKLTKLQEKFRDTIDNLGGLYVEAHSVDDLWDVISRFGKRLIKEQRC